MTTRILHVSQPTTEGVGRFVRALARYQREQELTPVVACPAGGNLAAWLTDEDVEVRHWPASRSLSHGMVSEAKSLDAIVTSTEPAVIHLHSSKAGLVGRCLLRRRTPTIFQPNGWSFLAAGRLSPLARAWERWAARWSDLIIAVGDDEAEIAERANIAAPVSVVPNGVDLSHFTYADEHQRTRARRELGLEELPTVVCVGRLCEQKGQDLLVDGIDALRAAVPTVAVVLVGSGPDEASLRERAGASVVFAGYQDDVRPWLAAADVVAMPSRWEGLPFVALEAWAVGRPVVAFDSANLPRVDGIGAIVSPFDTHEFVRELSRCLLAREPVAVQGRTARRYVETHHDASRMLSAITSHALDLAGERGVAGRARP